MSSLFNDFQEWLHKKLTMQFFNPLDLNSYTTYYRYNEKTGTIQLYRISDNPYMHPSIVASKFFTKAGKPRESVIVKGKRYFRSKV